MGKILDFGTESAFPQDNIRGADWVETKTGKETPYGGKILNVWCKEGSPIPAPDASYDVIHARWSLCHNDQARDWPFIFAEFKRLLAPGGIIVAYDSCCVQGNTPEKGDFTGAKALEESIKKAFTDAFPDKEGWNCSLNTEIEDEENVALQAYIYKYWE